MKRGWHGEIHGEQELTVKDLTLIFEGPCGNYDDKSYIHVELLNGVPL